MLGQEAGAISALLIAFTQYDTNLFANIWVSHLPSQILEFDVKTSNEDTKLVVDKLKKNFE